MNDTDGLRVVLAPRSRLWLRAVSLGVAAVLVALSWLSWEILALAFFIAVFGFRASTRGEERGVWATADDLIISNSGQRVRVPKDGATTTIVHVEFDQRKHYPGLAPLTSGLRRPFKVDFDNANSAEMCLFVIPGHEADAWVHVQAARGLTPKRVRELAAAIDAEISSR